MLYFDQFIITEGIQESILLSTETKRCAGDIKKCVYIRIQDFP